MSGVEQERRLLGSGVDMVVVLELHCEFWCKDFRSRLPGVVFAAVSFPLDEFHYKGAEPLMREFLRRACGSDIQCVEEDFVA